MKRWTPDRSGVAGRDDFPRRTKDLLAKRVGHLCSNPECSRPTSGPQKDPKQALSIGVAAHITAASPEGPRYSPDLPRDERVAPTNGIWLCETCAKLIDSDLLYFTPAVLREWKHQAETRARSEVQQRSPVKPTLASRPTLTLQQAPHNLFEFCQPGVSLERARHLLGPPHRTCEGQFSYTFRDAFLQLTSPNRESVETIAIALCASPKEAQFPIYPTDFVLGATTLAEVLADDHEPMIYRSSTRHEEVVIRSYYGLPGFNRHFTFGALWAPFVWSSDFTWDSALDRLASDASEVLVNWAAISAGSDEIWFDFWAFR